MSSALLRQDEDGRGGPVLEVPAGGIAGKRELRKNTIIATTGNEVTSGEGGGGY